MKPIEREQAMDAVVMPRLKVYERLAEASKKRLADSVKTNEQYEEQASALKVASRLVKDANAERQQWVKPFNDAVRQINGSYKKTIHGLSERMEITKNALIAFDESKRKRAQTLEDKKGNTEMDVMIKATNSDDAGYFIHKTFRIENLAKAIGDTHTISGMKGFDEWASSFKKKLLKVAQGEEVMDGVARIVERRMRVK